jgi:hypothetical protein
VLAAGAVLVFGLGVYLFLEVRSRPASAQVPPDRAPSPRDPERPASAPPSEAGGRPQLAGAPREAAEPAPAPAGGSPDRDARPGPTSRAALMSGFRERPRPEGTPPDQQPHKLDEVMDEANKAYDRGDLDEAKAIAQRVLARSPNNVRMLRVVVTASCIAGDTADAQKAYLILPKFDREQMKTRCGRYGVTFDDR